LASSKPTSDAVVGVATATELPVPVRAFLDVIAFAEGTDGSYNMSYGGKLFSGFADHPRTWRASPWGTPGVGSDAAGRYQFLSTSWDEARQALKLKDFSPANQDRAAAYLMKRNSGATYERVKFSEQRANFNAAVASLSYVWASLPPQRYKNQRVRNIEDLWFVYQKALRQYK
jgi:muramidase (phage lysozyme)